MSKLSKKLILLSAKNFICYLLLATCYLLLTSRYLKNSWFQTGYGLDENVSSAIAQGLRQKNIDITTTDETNLIGVSDEKQLAHALKQNRVIFTHDADFLRLHNKGVQHSGIIYCSQRKLTTISTGEIISFLELVYLSMTTKAMANHIEFV